MHLRKFTAENYSAALALVKRELGGDALILNTRSLEDDSARKGAASRVEITAAVDMSHVARSSEMGRGPSGLPKPKPAGIDDEEIDLQLLVRTLLGKTEKAQSLGLKDQHLGLFSRLVDSGIGEKLASKMIDRAQREISGSRKEGSSGEEIQVMELMKRVMGFGGGIQLVPGKQKRVALVGPTGAGKTTTLAKLAADFSLRQKKKIALISLDTFRLGAFDQLRIYADIMKVPVEMAFDKNDFWKAVKKHADKDIVFIDTMGRNHRDLEYSRDLKEIFDTVGGVETHLVASVGTQEKIIQQSWRQFADLGIHRALFTKMDEGLSFGSLFNFSLRTRVPFSYFTTGQRVPEDIEVASGNRVISLIFN